MRALSDILADPNGGSRMSEWLFSAMFVLAGVGALVVSVIQMLRGNSDWWMGVPVALVGLPELLKLMRKRSLSDARR